MKVTAAHICESITLKPLLKQERENARMRNPLVLSWRGTSVALFPFGVAVFWDVSLEEQKSFSDEYEKFLVRKHETPLHEVHEVTEGKNYSFNDDLIIVPAVSLETIVVISVVLARSLALEDHEKGLNALMNQFQLLHTTKHGWGKIGMLNNNLLRISSDVMEAHQVMSISVAMLDTPDIVWDDNELRTFYNKLLEEYEIKFRYTQLTYKLKLLMQHVEFMLHLMENKKMFWLEVVIVVLIFVEIVLFVFDLLAK